MRISTKRLKRRRLKLIEAKKEGAIFSELQRRFRASPNYLSKLFKGREINKYCKDCGENDPEVLVKHHPDKENRPDYFKWLCSNCHSKVTREQAKKKAKQKVEKQNIPTESLVPQKIDDRDWIIDRSISVPKPAFQYSELNKAQKIVLGLILGGTTIDCLWGEKIRDYFQKRQKETKIKRELQTSEANANQQSSPVGREGFVTTSVGKTLISRTPAKIIEEYPKAFKVQLPDTRKIVIPKDKFEERA